jgi:hypothetical protein
MKIEPISKQYDCISKPKNKGDSKHEKNIIIGDYFSDVLAKCINGTDDNRIQRRI